jgi:hypothetical protein
MSLKEFGWKTGLFLLLPGLLTYSCLREQEDLVRIEAAQRACLKALYSPTVTTLLLVGQVPDGHLVHKRITDTAALRQVRSLAQYLRPVRVTAGGYRSSIRRYELGLVSGPDTCKLVVNKMPPGRADLLRGLGDSAYEAPRFIPFLDSLFRSGTVVQ